MALIHPIAPGGDPDPAAHLGPAEHQERAHDQHYSNDKIYPTAAGPAAGCRPPRTGRSSAPAHPSVASTAWTWAFRPLRNATSLAPVLTGLPGRLGSWQQGAVQGGMVPLDDWQYADGFGGGPVASRADSRVDSVL